MDSSSTIGTGHFIRSLALAQRFSFYGYDPVFVSSCLLSDHQKLLEDVGYGMELVQVDIGEKDDANTTKMLAKNLNASWIILDGYSFSEEYQKSLRGCSPKVAIIDDYYSATGYPVDAIINYNLYAEDSPYQKQGSQALCLIGPRYSILRSRFLDFRRKKPLNDTVRNVLVTLGGTDTQGRTAWVIEGIEQSGLEYEELIVINGKGSANELIINEKEGLNHGIKIIRGTNEMPELMDWADFVITAGGTTTYELLYMAKPFITILAAENQRMNAIELEKRGISRLINGMEIKDTSKLSAVIKEVSQSYEKRREMVEKGSSLVDGFGANRIVSNLIGLKFWLRQAIDEDMEMVWNWANDPISRSFSIRTDPIPWEEHVKWYTSKLSEQECLMLIAFTDDDRPIGILRIEVFNGFGKVSVNIDPGLRGRGYGQEIIRAGCRIGAHRLPLGKFDAFVKLGNSSSLRAFKQVGFREIGMSNIDGQECHHLIMER